MAERLNYPSSIDIVMLTFPDAISHFDGKIKKIYESGLYAEHKLLQLISLVYNFERPLETYELILHLGDRLPTACGCRFEIDTSFFAIDCDSFVPYPSLVLLILRAVVVIVFL